ncbi:MAG: NADH dehydrogenase (quinone) subunit D [Candidatus Kapaibacteriota bacterium]
MNVTTKSKVEEINRIRNHKLYKELLGQDVSLLMQDALENDLILNMGPQHPATHGVLRVVLRLDGETIINAVPELGYLHRGYEKLAENVTYHEFIPHTDRLDYISPMSNNVAIALAIENALGIEAPPRAQWIRTLVSEMARISSHLMAIGSTCLDLGAMTVFLWTFIEREKLYDLFQEICGARFTTSYTRIGGVANDIPDNILQAIKKWLDEFPALLKKAEALVDRNRIFIDRMAGIGYLSKEKAIALGATGPTLRGSGIPRDLRKDSPYLVYDQLDFNVITENDGDTLSRYMVRVNEMYESAKILHQILDKMPKGEILANKPKAVLPHKNEVYTKMEELIHDFMLINFGAAPEKGETYTAIESPKGELGFFIVSDGTGHPWKLKMRSPSTSNLQTLAEMARGSMIADMVVIIGSVDPIMGEADK